VLFDVSQDFLKCRAEPVHFILAPPVQLNLVLERLLHLDEFCSLVTNVALLLIYFIAAVFDRDSLLVKILRSIDNLSLELVNAPFHLADATLVVLLHPFQIVTLPQQLFFPLSKGLLLGVSVCATALLLG